MLATPATPHQRYIDMLDLAKWDEENKDSTVFTLKALNDAKVEKKMNQSQASKFGRVQILKNFENLSIWGFMGAFGGIWICNTDNSRKFGFLWFVICWFITIW